jgi:Mg2+ and Co2+ transporter CorA
MTTAAFTFPLVLYATNGIMPIATVARHGYWWAVILGVIAMGLPLWLSVRAGQRQKLERERALGATPLTA